MSQPPAAVPQVCVGANNTSVKANTFESVPRLTLLATFTAFTGVVLLLIGISFAIDSFNHNSALLPYSCRNHMISELGFPYASPLTWLFNGAVMIGGLMLLPTNYALGAHLRTRLGYAAASFGCLGGLALSGLGMFGLRQDVLHAPYLFGRFFKIHMAFAQVIFLGWTVGITLFTMLFYRRRNDPVSCLMALAGIVSGLVYLTFLEVSICPSHTQAALVKATVHPPKAQIAL